MPNNTQPETNLRAQTLDRRKACKEFARRNLPALCGEIVHWKETAQLPDHALLRQLGKLVAEWAPRDFLSIAEAIVVREGLYAVSQMSELALDAQAPVVREEPSAQPEDLPRQR